MISAAAVARALSTCSAAPVLRLNRRFASTKRRRVAFGHESASKKRKGFKHFYAAKKRTATSKLQSANVGAAAAAFVKEMISYLDLQLKTIDPNRMEDLSYFVSEHAKMNMPFTLWTDGGSRGNPGDAGAGWVIKCPEGEETLIKCALALPGDRTSNFAEYTAAICGLYTARHFEISHLCLRMDSQLVAKQYAGEFAAKEPTLREMLAAMRRTGDEFKELEVRHVMRASNKTADTLANKAIDIKQGKKSFRWWHSCGDDE